MSSSSSSSPSPSLLSVACRRFSLSEIKDATNNFDKISNYLGKGGEGIVYLGHIPIDGQEKRITTVAVKQLKPDSIEFENEIKIISRIQHPNLVSLLGYCNEFDQKILVYEYMQMGSLSDYVKMSSDICLSWKQRLQICLGAARGLQYLHTATDELPKGIIHRDMKPANILLDKDWVAKVSDFGLFKLSHAGQTHSTMFTELKGTCGYYAPEYFRFFLITRKIDVYAFGVVLFEVLCRKRPWDRGDESYYVRDDEDLGHWAQENVDTKISEEISDDSLEIFVDIIRRSLRPNPNDRPNMDEVVRDLVGAQRCHEREDHQGIPPVAPRLIQQQSSFDMALAVLEDAGKKVSPNRAEDIEEENKFDVLEVNISNRFEDARKKVSPDRAEDIEEENTFDSSIPIHMDSMLDSDLSPNKFDVLEVFEEGEDEEELEAYINSTMSDIEKYDHISESLHVDSSIPLRRGVSQGPIVDAMGELLLQDVTNFLYVNGQYFREFESQFKDLEEQLRNMQGFVIDAENLKGKHETVRSTLNALRELMYDADDLVIECVIRADYRRMRESSSWFRLSPHDLFFRYQTGKKLTSINSRIVKSCQNLSKYLSPIVGQPNSDHGSSNRPHRWTSPVFDLSKIVGLDKDAKTIKGWIFSQSEVLHRIGIVGKGGLGKTTITQKIFNDKQVQARFRARIWLSISQTFCEIDIMKRILNKLKEDDGAEGDLLLRVHQALSRTTYLIVFDDVWSLKNGWWGRISQGLPKIEGQNSCIIITSRNEDVAKGMGVTEARIHRPKLLDPEESWLLFCKVAFMSTNGTCKDRQLKEIGNEIVEICRGLPLTIKTIGGMLSSKVQPYEWKRISENFREIASASNAAVRASLQLSYDELPTHLKHCLLCFSVYPEDYEISTEQLVRWWVGEGFVHETLSETAIGRAFNFLTELISRCLVEVVEKRNYDGRVYSCKVHDMVWDLTIRIAREETFCSFDERCVQIPTADSRRLGITGEMKNFRNLRGNSKLRALLLMTNRPIHFHKDNPLAKVNTLRVLDLSHLKLDNVCVEDLWNWICSLKRLGYLNLRDVTGLVELPHSIGKLWGLQTLILAGCIKLRKLPASIGNLFRLKVLDVGNCTGLNCLPQKLSRLVELQELYGFKVPSSSDTEGCQFGELRGLTKLRVLQVDIQEESIIKEADLTVLIHHDKLKILSFNANNLENKDLLAKVDRLVPPKNLEEVYLRRYNGGNIPKWVNPTSLPQVEYLCLEDFKSANAVNPEFWGHGEATWKVEGLCMKYLTKLPMNWEILKSVMPSLRYLEVGHCYKFQDFPGFGYWRPKEEVIDCQDEEDNISLMNI